MCWKRLKNETQDPDFLHILELKLKSLEGKPAVEHILSAESPISILRSRIVRAAGSAFLSWAEQQKKEETPLWPVAVLTSARKVSFERR
jgi:hypothetical protein